MIKRFAKWLDRKKIPPSACSGIMMVIKLITIIIIVMIALWGLGINTTAIGVSGSLMSLTVAFASQQLIGNILAGLYIIITHPFYVGDYIHVGGSGNIEGIVREITLNFTRIQTKDDIYFILNNQEMMAKEILNYRYIEDKSKENKDPMGVQETLKAYEEERLLYRYRIKLDFDYSLSVSQIKQILSDMVERYKGRLPKSAEYYPMGFDDDVMNYMFVIYVKDPEDIFTLKPQLVEEILEAREKLKSQKL
jgi:small-conductance mechanosensitive channel